MSTHLSHRVRRRRLLVIRQSSRIPATATVRSGAACDPLGTTVASLGAEAVDVGPPLTEVMSVPLVSSTPALTKAASAVAQAGAEFDAGTRLAQRLAATHDLTWVIAGDSLEPNGAAPREWRNFAGRLMEHVRHQLGRAGDLFLVSAACDRNLQALSAEADRQILRSHPDIVLLTISPLEARAGKRGLHTFERQLIGLISQVAATGAVLCLATPPLAPAGEDSDAVNQMIYAEAVRSIAAEYDLPLVDHFAHWEAVATEIGGLERWYDAESRTPGRIGHEQLARRVIADLHLDAVSSVR